MKIILSNFLTKIDEKKITAKGANSLVNNQWKKILNFLVSV